MSAWGVSDVTVKFGTTIALNDVSMVAEPGTVTAVVGGDGAGKSTLLRVLVGVIAPDAGTAHRPPRSEIGFLAGQNAVYDDLTVDENLDFVCHAYGLPTTSPRRTELLARTGLEAARKRLGAQLSGGMRQKLGVAMALMPQPKLVVLDEPTTGVDPVSRNELSRLMSHAAAEGAAVVLSTTYLSEAARANEVVVLDDGSMLVSGAPSQIVSDVPGVVYAVDERPDHVVAWRREAAWHYWSPVELSAGAIRRIVPDLEDAVLVAALSRAELATRGSA